MLSLEEELATAGASEELLRIERRELVSVHPELRLATYAGVALVVGAVGSIIKDHLDEIGPVAIATAIGAAAAGLYLFLIVRKGRGKELGGLHEFLALLAGLLVSSDVGYIESQFHLLDQHWSMHLIFLTVIHAVFAYYLGSRMLLSLALTSLVTWFGVDRSFGMFDSSADVARQAMLAGGAIIAWRFGHAALSKRSEFLPSFEHFAANLILSGAISLVVWEQTELLGHLVLLAGTITCLAIARKQRREMFAIYAVLYELLGVSISIVRGLFHHDGELFIAFYLFAAFGAAIVSIFVIHAKWKLEER